jgi:hypothetical protein
MIRLLLKSQNCTLPCSGTMMNSPPFFFGVPVSFVTTVSAPCPATVTCFFTVAERCASKVRRLLLLHSAVARSQCL